MCVYLYVYREILPINKQINKSSILIALIRWFCRPIHLIYESSKHCEEQSLGIIRMPDGSTVENRSFPVGHGAGTYSAQELRLRLVFAILAELALCSCFGG